MSSASFATAVASYIKTERNRRYLALRDSCGLVHHEIDEQSDAPKSPKSARSTTRTSITITITIAIASTASLSTSKTRVRHPTRLWPTPGAGKKKTGKAPPKADVKSPTSK